MGARSRRRPRRTVSAGSSARAVPEPTMTASTSSRRRCTRPRDSGPVIQRESPRRVAMRPSRLAASFSETRGRPVSIQLRKPRCWKRQASSRTPTRSSTPARRSRAMPLPRTFGFGSRSPIHTRAMPASWTAAAQGGVRPWWLQGSSVTARLAPRRARAPCRLLAASSARTSAWSPPAGWVKPRPSTRSPRTTTAPTGGLGHVRPDARRAWARARPMAASGVTPPPSSCPKRPGWRRSRRSPRHS